VAARDTIPPLFTLGGPVGWMFAAFSWFAGLGKSHEKERQLIFKAHRERNEARGWKRGDNILRALGTGEMEARRSAAERAIQQVNDIIGTLPRAPWLQRKKSGKSGGLYTIKDVRNNVVRQSQAVSNAKIKAAQKESAHQRSIRRGQVIARNARTRDTGVWAGRGRGLHTGGLADAAGFLIDTIQTEAIRRARLSQRVARLSNRRGHLASQPLRTRGFPGRTAAGDSGRSGAASSSTGATSNSAGASKQPGNVAAESQHSSTREVASESTASREAKRVLSQSRSLPATVVGTKGASQLSQLLGLGAASAMFNTSGGFATSARTSSARLTRTSSPTRLTSPLSMGSALTPLNAVGVQSQSCNCPKPKSEKKKTKKDGSPRCVNPVLSRTTRDGIRTTRVKLECQPSKPKLP